jgi:hypothetical protein
MSKISNVRLPNASVSYDSSQFNQLVRSLEQIILELNTAYSSIGTENKDAALTWYESSSGPLPDPVVDYIDFNTTPGTIPHQTGRVNWDVPDACLEIDQEYGVVQQVGQEIYARVSNNTGVTIPNGTAVGFAGATTESLRVSPYLADGASPTVYILGVMTHDLPDSGLKGYCTTFGFVRDLDTTGTPYGETWAAGDILYASPSVAGGLTKVKPTAPNNVIIMAAVTTVSATEGIIFVRPTIMAQMYYGNFARTTSYAPAVADTAYAVPFDSTIISNGVSVGTPTSRIVVVESGFYSVSCTLQYSSSNASAKTTYTWIRKNGVDVAQSSRLVSLDSNGGYQLGVVSESISLGAGDYIEIMVAVTDIAATLAAVGATAFAPGSPAANLIIQQIQQ